MTTLVVWEDESYLHDRQVRLGTAIRASLLQPIHKTEVRYRSL